MGNKNIMKKVPETVKKTVCNKLKILAYNKYKMISPNGIGRLPITLQDLTGAITVSGLILIEKWEARSSASCE